MSKDSLSKEILAGRLARAKNRIEELKRTHREQQDTIGRLTGVMRQAINFLSADPHPTLAGRTVKKMLESTIEDAELEDTDSRRAALAEASAHALRDRTDDLEDRPYE